MPEQSNNAIRSSNHSDERGGNRISRIGRISPSAAILWSSAFVIAALVMMQAGRLPGNPAYADMAVESGGFTLLTVDAGHGGDTDPNELLYVLDSRVESLLVYEIEDARKKQIVLRGGANLPVWFRNARR